MSKDNPGLAGSSSISKAVAHERMVHLLGGRAMEADVVCRTAHTEVVAPGRELTDQVGRTAVVRVPAGLRAQDGDGVAAALSQSR